MKRIVLLMVIFAMACVGMAAPLPPHDLMHKVGFEQRLGSRIPLDLQLTDAHGRVETLGAWVGQRPVLLLMGYFHCPNLCDAVLQGLAHSVARAGLTAGKDVSVIFVSVDPRDTSSDAGQMQQMVAHMSGNRDINQWHFLIASSSTITTLADAVGYRYWYDPALQQYAHPAGVVVGTDTGQISQYLLGVSYPPTTLHDTIIAASRHTLGRIVDQLVLLCCGYDPTTGRYSITVGKIMQWLGLGFTAALVLALCCLWRRSRKRAPL